MQTFHPNKSHIDEDFDIWSSIIVKHLNNHAPFKTKRVKSKRLPEWFTADILEMQNKRDTYKRRFNSANKQKFLKRCCNVLFWFW